MDFTDAYTQELAPIMLREPYMKSGIKPGSVQLHAKEALPTILSF